MELLNFEEHEQYEADLERFNRRQKIHEEAGERKKKQAVWTKYKQLKYGKRPIG